MKLQRSQMSLMDGLTYIPWTLDSHWSKLGLGTDQGVTESTAVLSWWWQLCCTCSPMNGQWKTPPCFWAWQPEIHKKISWHLGNMGRTSWLQSTWEKKGVFVPDQTHIGPWKQMKAAEDDHKPCSQFEAKLAVMQTLGIGSSSHRTFFRLLSHASIIPIPSFFPESPPLNRDLS